MLGGPIQYPAQALLSELPRECLFPPPSCPVPWVRPRQRWYFDPSSRTCSQFQYSCGEGVNNFHTQSLCSSYCQESRQPFIPKYPSLASQVHIPILTASTLPQYIRSNKNTLVEFYTEWCSACRNFWPKFQTIASTLRYLVALFGNIFDVFFTDNRVWQLPGWTLTKTGSWPYSTE